MRIIRGAKAGVALMTALMIAVFLLIIGLGFLSSSQRDLQFQKRQQLMDQAQTLARSGLEYYQYLAAQIPSEAPPIGTPDPYPVGTNGEFVLESLDGAGSYKVAGRVYHNDGTLAVERVIIVPLGVKESAYDATL